MAKRISRRKRNLSRSKKMYGGNTAPVDSGHNFVLDHYGDGNTQWDNVFGPNSTSIMGNEIVNLEEPQRVPAMLYPMKGGSSCGMNTMDTMNAMKGGKRRTRKMRSRGGQLISAASATPFALWGMQNMYSRKMKSRKMKKRGGQLINPASATPFALWGMQNMYSKKSKKSKK